MFHPEAVSRPEAGCESQANLQAIQKAGIAPSPGFGTQPAFTSRGSEPRGRQTSVRSSGASIRNSRRCRRTTNRAVTRARFAKQFPPQVVPQTNCQQPARNPWSAAWPGPTRNAALIPPKRTTQIAISRRVAPAARERQLMWYAAISRFANRRQESGPLRGHA